MKTGLLVFLFLNGILLESVAQSPVLISKQCYGGMARDMRPQVLVTSDKGFLLTGYGNSVDGDFSGTTNAGGDDMQILKTDVCGNVIWKKQYGGTRFEQTFTVTPSPDKGYLLSGNTTSTELPNYHGGPWDALLCKIDESGNLQWLKSFGGSGLDNLLNAVYLPDSSFIMAGNSSSTDGDAGGTGDIQGWLLKLDKNGNVIWKKTYGSTATDNFLWITATPDGNFIACGQTNRSDATNKSDVWVVKVDPSGNVIWDKTYGGTADESSMRIKQVPAGGFIVSGNAASPELPGHHGGVDAWVLHIDENGNLLWQRCVGGSGNELINDMTVLADNTILFAGSSSSSNGDILTPNQGGPDAFAFCLDASGNLLWNRTFGGSAVDLFSAVVKTADGSFIFSGQSASVNGDISGNHGATDIILFRLKFLETKMIDTSSCGQFFYQGYFITTDTAWTDKVKDQCGYDSATVTHDIKIITPPLVQTIGDTTIFPGESVLLQTSSSGPVQWTGAGLSCYSCLNPLARPVVPTTYIVKTGTPACFASDTVKITVSYGDTLFIPSAFTPNNDGHNDRFIAIGSATNFHLQIFNRWGQNIFESRTIQNGWDGRFKLIPQPTGIYVYQLRYKTLSGQLRMRKGVLTLIR
jgi:gliding motility-associated-like protein